MRCRVGAMALRLASIIILASSLETVVGTLQQLCISATSETCKLLLGPPAYLTVYDWKPHGAALATRRGRVAFSPTAC